MPSLGDLHYSLSIRDNTEADLRKINEKLRNLGFDIVLTPKMLKDITQAAVPKGVKIELDPTIKTEAIAKAVEGKTMRVAVTPLLTGFREAIAKATRENPPTAEVGVSETRLRSLIQNVLNKQGFILNVSTVNDNYSKAIQAKLNGTPYKVKIHVDAREITQSVQASLMRVQSRYFGLKVSRDILYRSIDEALGQKRFNINIAVSHGQARQAVQDALLRAQVIGKDQALAYQRLQTGEMKAAQAELLRLKAAQHGAADAAKAHATASANLGGALGSNIKIAGKLGSSMASLYSLSTLKEFLAQVVQIGGELEHQKIAMDTIFGDKGKTNELFSQIKGLARNSPFGVMELSKSVKALSAYGVEYNAIYDTAKRLAGISAATSVDINRLILAFGKTKSRGFLDDLEAKQFAYANIPIYEMVRKKLEELEGQAVTTADVMARMKKREIGFDIVQSVLWDITDPGGKFYDMQEALAGSVKTSWKLVRDNLELMFGEIAESGIGSGLKGLAEGLQELTQKWKTVGLVVAAAAAELGIYKLATLATNMTVQKSTTAIYSNIMAQKKKNAEELKAWGRITQLDRVEKMRIATADKLTNSDLRNALTSGQLTDKHIAQLFWQKKINAAQVEYLAKIGLIDPMMKKAMLSNNAFARTLALVAVGLKSATKAAIAFLFNPWTAVFAALSAAISVSMSYKEQMEKAEELSENLFTKADEGAKSLKATLKDLKPAEQLEKIQLDRGIETLETAIKDYSPTPIKDINDALVDQDGHVRSLAERYEVLREKVEATAAAYDAIRNGKDSEILGYSIKETGNLFNDTVLKNAKDYSEAIKRYDREITSYNRDNKEKVREIVKWAKDNSEEFAKAAETLGTVEAQFRELITGKYRFGGKYNSELFDARQTIQKDSTSNWGVFKLFGDGKDTAAFKFEKDVEQQIINIKTKIKELWGVDDVKKLSEAQKFKLSVELKSMLDGAEGVSEEVKSIWAAMFEKAFNVQVMDDKIGPALKANFRKMMAEGMKEGVKDAKLYREVAAVLQAEGYNKLSKAGKELADRVMEEAKKAAIKDLGIMTGEMQTYLTNNPLSQIITLTYQDGTQNALQREIIQKRGVAGYYGSTKTYVDNWTKSGKIDEARSNAQSEGKALKKTLTEAKKTGVGIEDAQKAWDGYQAAIDYLGWGDLDLSENKGRGKSDEFAKRLEQRLKDVKDAYAMYKKWSQIESSDLAFKRVGNSGLFSSLDPDKVPKTADEYRKIIEEIESELNAAGVKGSQRETLLDNLIKERFGIDEDTAKAQLQAALDKVSREAEKQLSNWQLYDKIRKATGDENFAISFAFGDEGGETDYVELIKKRFDRIAQQYEGLENLTFDAITDESQLTNVPDKVKEAWKTANSDIVKYFEQQREAIAGILSEYQTLQERVDTINAKRNENLNAINAKDSDGNFLINDENKRNSLAAQVNAKADYDIFKQSTEYLQFFNDIYGLTQTEANRIGDLIQQKLNANLQAGLITLSDYEKEMKKVREQLDKVRNVKSNAMTFLTGGVKGLNEKKLQKEEGRLANDPKYQEALAKMQAAQNELNAAQQEGSEADIAAKEEALRLAKQEVAAFTKVRDAIIKNQAAWEKVLNVANIASDITSGLSDAFGSIKEMAESYGVDTESGAWADIGSVLETMDAATSGISQIIQSAMNGSVGGILGGVVSTITTPFTIWSANHDKKLQKEIERSQEEVRLLKNLNNFIERRMEYFLGNPRNMDIDFLQEDKRKADEYRSAKERYKSSGGKDFFAALGMVKYKKYEDRVTAYEEGGAYKYQRQLMIEERTELERQKRAEEGKKHSDSGAIADYADQIDELNEQIRQFAEETAKSLYGIDFKAWAADLGDALMDAFAKGEDAAKAFDDTVADIMRNVVKSMMITNILEPMFEDLRKFLFGENGDSGAFGSDYELDPEETAMLKAYLDRIQTKGIPAAQELYDAINEATGGILDDPEAKEGLSAGIQGVTEDTADLLASYLNAIRADVSEQTHILWPRLLDDMLPQMNAIAESQLREQRKIAANTLINANAAVAIEQSNAEIRDILKRNIAGGGDFRIS